MRILLAEDDPMLGDGLRAGLRQQGFQVDWVRDGLAAERELITGDYQAAVLDLGLPFKDGLDVLKTLRNKRMQLPILVLTARDAVPERIKAHEVLTCGSLQLNPAARQVSFESAVVALSTREFDLLRALMIAVGRVLSREQIEQQLYSWGHEVESNAVEVHIHHLRKKLKPEVIQTVRGIGYTLMVPKAQLGAEAT